MLDSAIVVPEVLKINVLSLMVLAASASSKCSTESPMKISSVSDDSLKSDEAHPDRKSRGNSVSRDEEKVLQRAYVRPFLPLGDF